MMNFKQNFAVFYLIASICTTLGDERTSTPPLIIEQPLEHVVLFHTSQEKLIRLSCNATGEPTPIYSWTKDGSDIDRKTDTLIINSTNVNASGKYQCSAKNVWGTAMSNSVFLREVQNESDSDKKIISAKLNETVTLKCTTNNESHSISINWKFNGEERNNGTNSSLEIRNFQVDNQGNYTCEVINTQNNETTTQVHNFQVIVEPYFITEPQIVKEVEYKSVEFPCEYSSTDTVDIRWTYNGIPINELSFYKNLSFSDTDDCTIKITNATRNHTGNYGFNITNRFGYVYKDVYLLVKSALTEQVEPTHQPPKHVLVDKADDNSIAIILIVVSILLGMIVVFFIIMKCKKDATYGDYYLADREANVSTNTEPNPSQAPAAESSNNRGPKNPKPAKRNTDMTAGL